MSQKDDWTVGRLLQWTAQYLKDHGSESPRLDAEVLLAEVLGCQRIELYTAFDQSPDQQARAAYRELVRRRAQGVPVAYLVGHREFYSLDFRVGPDVLIPRPETELLVVALLDLAKNLPGPIAVADVGTGSGIIAVCAAKHLPDCRVTAVDVSTAALAIARDNARRHGVEDKIEFVRSDLFAEVERQQRFDFIVSNPPYVSKTEMQHLAAEVRQYEPKVALVAGQRGTEVIEALVSQAADRLATGGYLLIEISPTIHDDVRAMLQTDSRFELSPTIKDLARLPRVLQAQKKSS